MACKQTQDQARIKSLLNHGPSLTLTLGQVMKGDKSFLTRLGEEICSQNIQTPLTQERSPCAFRMGKAQVHLRLTPSFCFCFSF